MKQGCGDCSIILHAQGTKDLKMDRVSSSTQKIYPFPFQFTTSPLSRVSCSKIQHTDPYLVLTRYSNHYFPRCYYWQHPPAIGSALTSAIFPFHVETNEIFSTIWLFLFTSPFPHGKICSHGEFIGWDWKEKNVNSFAHRGYIKFT